MFADRSVVSRKAIALAAELDGETVLFHPELGAYIALGAVGSRVWELLEKPQSVAELCATLCAEYDVDAAACRRDVLVFLGELNDAELIETRA
jgi:hypothetical protein